MLIGDRAVYIDGSIIKGEFSMGYILGEGERTRDKRDLKKRNRNK
jgi:hypothetical protein